MQFLKDQSMIRPIDRNNPLDLEEVLTVYQQCEDFLALGPVAKASSAMVQADLDLSIEEGGVFYGIFDRVTGQIMGVVDYVLSGFEGDPELAFLSLLMIAAPYRSCGLGAIVVQLVEDAIRQDGRSRRIRSGVQINNPNGIRFWQHMGYRIISGPELMPDQTVVFGLIKTL